jgi:phosphoribosylformimino-5-aminoimidazole carboxamide ribotide isomerase
MWSGNLNFLFIDYHINWEEPHLKIIPVIDVLNGIAVHAIRGERRHYRPLKSVLCSSVDPVEMALTFESLGFDRLYLADLDAILGKPTDFALYQRIHAKTNLVFMVDAGVAEVSKAEKLLKAGVSEIVIGTETLRSLEFVNQAVKSFGEDRVVVSVDLKRGKVMSVSENVKSMSPVLLVQKLEEIGVGQIILLDLDRVGTERGANVEVLKDVLERTKVKVLAGGGIRSFQDLENLRTLGASGALVATALHNGKLEVNELKSRGFPCTRAHKHVCPRNSRTD